MKEFKLDIDSSIKGIYLSSEMIDLINIVKCDDIDKLKKFIKECEQLSMDNNEIDNFIQKNLEELKSNVFEQYQNSFVSLQDKVTNREKVYKNSLEHVGIGKDEIDKYTQIFKQQGVEGVKNTLLNEKKEEYAKIAKSQHRFIASERDQIKTVTYDEISQINELLKNHNTILLGGGRYYDVKNKMATKDIPDMEKYDFYHIQRGLDFCEENGLHARYHTLLDKQTLDGHLAGNDKEQVLSEIKEYVEKSIDFINEYNSSHRIKDKDGNENRVIKSVDLFNEIISFDPPYVNRWQQEYGIKLDELLQVFNYALDNKPEGVTYVYNEPFLENPERRKAVIDLLKQMNEVSPGLVDTLGSQMHIETKQNTKDIVECFKDFKELQDLGFNIQITEFDMCIPESEMFNKDGSLKNLTSEEKQNKMQEIQQIIAESGVKLDGLTYWSVSDTLDHNLERTNSKTFLAKDFYSKFKSLCDEKDSITLDELLQHPYITKEQTQKFIELYNQKGGLEKLDKIINSTQREVATSRLAGLYSDISRTKENKSHETENMNKGDKNFRSKIKAFFSKIFGGNKDIKLLNEPNDNFETRNDDATLFNKDLKESINPTDKIIESQKKREEFEEIEVGINGQDEKSKSIE